MRLLDGILGLLAICAWFLVSLCMVPVMTFVGLLRYLTKMDKGAWE